jgi:prepilin-type processing-associated H-X9-DG protein
MAESDPTSEGNDIQPAKQAIWPFILGAVAIVGAVVGVNLYNGWTTAWEKMVRLDCLNNLRQISVPCREYAAQHDGHFPSSWVELNLVGEDAGWAKLLHCPESHHEVGIWSQVDLWSDYRLLPGRSTNDPANTILALEPLTNHGGMGANVLYVDGSTQWLPAARLLGLNIGMATNSAAK